MQRKITAITLFALATIFFLFPLNAVGQEDCKAVYG